MIIIEYDLLDKRKGKEKLVEVEEVYVEIKEIKETAVIKQWERMT